MLTIDNLDSIVMSIIQNNLKSKNPFTYLLESFKRIHKHPFKQNFEEDITNIIFNYFGLCFTDFQMFSQDHSALLKTR